MNPTLRKVCKIIESQKRILFPPTRSYYSAMSAEVTTKYGLNVHGCIFDELLGQRDRELYDVMTSGSGAARRQPLNFVITAAGRDRTSICWEMHTKAMDIIEGRKIDTTFYPVVFSAPDDADWTCEEVWKSVCPSLGKTVSLEFMRNQCESAKQDSAEEMNFRQFFLCQWIYSAQRWLDMEKYDKGKEPIDLEQLKGRKCYGGLDLASSSDIAALVLVFPPENEDDDRNVYGETNSPTNDQAPTAPTSVTTTPENSEDGMSKGDGKMRMTMATMAITKINTSSCPSSGYQQKTSPNESKNTTSPTTAGTEKDT